MGKHTAQKPSGLDGHGLLGTLVAMLRLPGLVLIELLIVIVGLSVLSVVVGNKFGSVWGAIVGIAIAPYIVVRLLHLRTRR
jgi:uncharacterized membrane protein YdjX (TVP38/TMEM64 family)